MLALNSIVKPPFEIKRITVWQLAFQARKVLGTFEKQAPGSVVNETVTGLRKSYTYFNKYAVVRRNPPLTQWKFLFLCISSDR